MRRKSKRQRIARQSLACFDTSPVKESRLPMPKRTDIKKILIIGSGPIVIGQACEFDYSGTQACKALRAEGYEVVLVNSNPATIMTDPELAASHLHRTAHQGISRGNHRAKSAPTRCCPPSAAKPALNLAVELAENGILEKLQESK